MRDSLPQCEKHLKLNDGNKAYLSFNASIGLTEVAKDIDPVKAENWQILSPVRNNAFGTTELNRKIQAKYRGGMLNTARNPWSKVPKPFGEQEIVYTDKVMQSINRRKAAYPKLQSGALDYVANGEIGLVVNTSKGGPKTGIHSGSSFQPSQHRPTTIPAPMSMGSWNSLML